MAVNDPIFNVIATLMILLQIYSIDSRFVRGPSITNWADAKAYCDANHDGLATITDAVELAEAQTECFKEGFSAMGCWFGLSAVIYPEDSTIVDWTLNEGGLPGTPETDWGWHRGLAVGNKIYLIGYTADAWVLDLDTDTWSSDTVPIPASMISLDGQFGAAINDEYYFMTWDGSSKVQKYVPGGSLDGSFATLNSGFKGKCFTANEQANILYVIDNEDFYFYNVTAGTPALTSGNGLGYPVDYPQCAYVDGYVYVFGGDGQDKISRVNVGENNENIGSATWEILSTTMPASGIQKGEAVVASNGKIYIGGINADGFRDKVYEFEPDAQTITEVQILNEERPQSAFIYVESLDRICALTGDNTPADVTNEGGLDSWECSNEIGLGGICTYSWDDGTAIDYGFNENDGTNPTTGLSPWYNDRPDGCGQGISNDFCGALGASGAACEQLWDDVDCDNTSPFPLCNGFPTTAPTTKTNSPTLSPTIDSGSSEDNDNSVSSEDYEAGLYKDENVDTQRNAESEVVRNNKHILITFSRAAVLNIYGIICILLLVICIVAYCFCFKHTKNSYPAYSSNV